MRGWGGGTVSNVWVGYCVQCASRPVAGYQSNERPTCCETHLMAKIQEKNDLIQKYEQQ